jgi:hypothetical protein
MASSTEDLYHTLAIRHLRNDLTRNLYLSSSVCIMTSAKDVPASIRDVLSSIVSIYTMPHADGVVLGLARYLRLPSREHKKNIPDRVFFASLFP